MSNASKTAESASFQPLSHSISFYEPQNHTKGQLIILATWLGGTARQIAKYTSLYRKLAPAASILLIRAPLYSVIAPYHIQRRDIRPAIDPITQIQKECGHHDAAPRPRILVHIFSNSGANNILELLQLWREETGNPLTLSGLVIDSSLAVGEPRENFRGFQPSIPPGLGSKILGLVAAYYALLALKMSIVLGRYPMPKTAMRECIFDESLVWMESFSSDVDGGIQAAENKRICYFVSKADQIAPFEDIVSHSEDAKERGWDVDLHLWDDTSHCNHLGKHGEEYMEAVRSMWELKQPEVGTRIRS